MSAPPDSRNSRAGHTGVAGSAQENMERPKNTSPSGFIQASNGKLYRRGSIKFARDMARTVFRGNWGLNTAGEDRTPEQVRAALDAMAHEQSEKMAARRQESALRRVALELESEHAAAIYAGSIACGGI